MKALTAIVSGIAVTSAFAWAGAGHKVVQADQNDALGKSDIRIDETNFPDKNFREYVLTAIDENHNRILDKMEIEETHIIFVYTTEIESLKGIEFFSNLAELDCMGVGMAEIGDRFGTLTDLDVSKNENLITLNCYGNRLTKLDVSQNLKLEWLDCFYNDLTSLDLSKNTELYHLDCQGNKITKLDLSNQETLQSLSCRGNRLTSLDLSECPSLGWLDCSDNAFTSLDIGKNTELGHLECESDQLTQLDLRSNLKLEELMCSKNMISKLDVSMLPELDWLSCDENRLTELDVRNNSKLQVLSCDDNPISELDLSRNTELYQLTCSDTRLTNLDLKNCTKLNSINCSGNNLGSLDIKHLKGLRDLFCRDCGLSELDLSAFTLLSCLDCSSNSLTRLDLHENQELMYVYAHYNQIDSLDVSACINICQQLSEPDCERKLMEDGSGSQKREYYAYVWDSGTIVVSLDTDTKLIAAGSIEDFIERLYTVALGRASEADGKAYWISEITEGRKTGGECGLFFLLGEEFTNRKLSDEDFVETLYSTFFDRHSEPDGKAYWLGALKNGSADREMVVRSFIDSTEWCNLCADYSVRSGAPTAKAERASRSAIDFTYRLYYCCLDRSAEDAGLNYWSLALTNLEQTGCSAAKEFFQSNEFVEQDLSDREYIKRLYLTFMDREANASEIRYWVGEIRNGTQTRDSVLAFFGQSEEFTFVCARYGIERGTM